MKLLASLPARLPEFQSIPAALDAGRSPVAVSGLSPVHRAHFAAALRQESGRPVVFVCADEADCDRLAADLTALLGEPALLLPAREFAFHAAAARSRQWEHARLEVLYAMTTGRAPIVVASVEGLLQRTLPPTLFAQTARTLRRGESYSLTELTEQLAEAGYKRAEQVEGVGQFALRGGILDFFSPAHRHPVRAEFWGDEIDTMGLFDTATQRRIEPLSEAAILPAAEVLPHLAPGGVEGLAEGVEALFVREKKRAKAADSPLLRTLEQDAAHLRTRTDFTAADRYLALIYPTLATAADFLPEDALVCFSESSRVAERAKNYLWQIGEDIKSLLESGLLAGELATLCATHEELCRTVSARPICYLDSFATGSYVLPPRAAVPVMAKQLPSYGASLETAVGDMAHYLDDGFSVVVLVSSEQRALKLQALLREHKIRAAVDFRLHDLPEPGRAVIAVGGLSAGLEYPEARVAILTEGGLTGPRAKRQKLPKNREFIASYTDLTPGDLVVHAYHGIGRFVELTTMQVDGIDKDYVKIAYAGADALYVPATQLDLVSKYIGGDTPVKKLSKLGGTDWERAKSRAKRAVADLAKGLVALYAMRRRLPGFAFSPDSPWQKEFEEQFEYVETGDQLRCAAEVKADMERAAPMDRLLCGDVGYGKTEVAFRAVMKCVLDGKQAAILVPTTVLARQHYLNAKARFAKYPVNIEVVSRFRSPAQIKAILRDLAEGKIDLLIGTHRLLQKDVRFGSLGLLVVDEEQRFGVTHKERLKELARQVDCLTLTATPIPRTLNMALSGIRDMSTLEEPPGDRQPVQTYVLEHDWSVLADAIRREVARGGQVYYLHNRVETIARAARRLSDLLGEDVSVAVAHGKMAQDEIGDVMRRMTDGELHVLVCTTIIETGIDIPNVNTLIIEDSDKLGLAQLHQIRGRVGRSARRAHAYLTYRQGKVLTEDSAKRLSAIREFAEFGSGFKIAMRDLEIRGAGNILGAEQSGFLLSVGYEMYLQLLEDAVLEEQGRPARRAECNADFSVAASIPDRYVPSAEQRMDLYRRIARIRTEEEGDDLTDELIDRYGDPPRPVNNLISIALLRGRAAELGMTDIAQKGNNLNFTVGEVDFARVSALCALEKYRGRLLFSAGERPYLSLRLRPGEDPLKPARSLLTDYAPPDGNL